jgi:hypothetical protein
VTTRFLEQRVFFNFLMLFSYCDPRVPRFNFNNSVPLILLRFRLGVRTKSVVV